MMKTINIAVLILLIITSCAKNRYVRGEGKIVSRTIAIDQFNGIDLSIDADVELKQGEKQQVVITSHANIIDRIATKVSNNIWFIELSKGRYKDLDIKIEVVVQDLENVSISGSGDIVIKDFENQHKLDVEISGSGNVELNKFSGAKSLNVEINGSGSVSGKSLIAGLEEMIVNISGSGSFDGFELPTQSCRVDISGSGNCRVFVTDDLSVEISGSGDVYYKGEPVIDLEVNGSGKVNDAN